MRTQQFKTLLADLRQQYPDRVGDLADFDVPGTTVEQLQRFAKRLEWGAKAKARRENPKKTVREFWEQAEPVGFFRSPLAQSSIFEVRKGKGGGYYAKVHPTRKPVFMPFSSQDEYIRVPRSNIEGGAHRISGETYGPYWTPCAPLMNDIERRRRLRELHPDRMGRDQTPAEREEYARIAQARA